MHPGTHAQATPDRAALIFPSQGVTITYGALEAASNRAAHLFRSLGLAPGDGIALVLENSPRFYEVVWGAQRAGLYYTPMSTRLTPGEAEYIVEDCDAKVLITSRATAGLAEALRDRLPRLVARFAIDGPLPGYASWEEAVARQPATPIADEVEGSDLLYSSGTTGRPKGVKLKLRRDPLGSPPALVRLVQQLYGFGPEMVYLSPAPLYHAAPLRFNLAVQRLGGTCVIMEHFDAAEFLRLIAEHRVTHTQVVPTMFIRMLKLPEAERMRHDVSSLRIAIHAAAPCPIPVKEAMIAWWGPTHRRVLRGHRGQRLLRHPLGRVARAQGLRRARDPRHDPHPGRRRPGAAPRRARDDLLRGRRRLRVPQGPGEDGVQPEPSGLVDARRHRLRRRRGLPLPDRPEGQHDHLRRRQHLPAGV